MFFFSKSLNNLSPSILIHGLLYPSVNHEISRSARVNLIKPFYKINRCRKDSITESAAESLNKIQKLLKNMLLKDLSPNKTKIVVNNFYLKLI